MPVVRGKLEVILAAERAVPDSHDWKEIVSILDSFPKPDLFERSVEDLRADVRTILAHGRSESVRLTIRPDGRGRGVSIMLALPRERFSGEMRREIQGLLEERLGGRVVDYQLALGEGEQARIHFYVTGVPAAPAVSSAALEREIAEHVRSWDERLRERLVAKFRGPRGRALAARTGALFRAEYKASTDVEEAVLDVQRLEELGAAPAAVDLLSPAGNDAERFAVLKVYLRGEQLVLSDFLPVLENLGLRVHAEDSVDLGEGDDCIHLHRFRVEHARGARLDPKKVLPLLAPALLEVQAGRAENDALNRLVIDAGLAWREVEVLRTYRNAAFQLTVAASRKALADPLLRTPDAARALFDLFAARLSLDAADRDKRIDRARKAFAKAIESVETAAEDRVLRAYAALVEATLRTNFYRPIRAEHPYVSVKLDSRALELCPKPRPLVEVHVHSARMEGVHLRGGKVARGGIRLSDRPDDFRTEVLGLMKTQMVKNAVIVPVGSKGGFVVKRPGAGEDGAREVRECYQTLVRGLLDLTDDVVKGVVVPPADVVRHDDDDPYLVVAADKGTATFSDLANAVAKDARFWLGDAFASGGSAGYDHKKEGITARGAWECVRRHFRELGKDPEKEAITVSGIGDMSGDVFGNGLLLSRTIQLRAAFNHLHVFLDPAPDSEASFRERERLFRLPRSSWTDYDPKVLSPGGAVVARSAKTVKLSTEVRAMLDVSSDRLDGEGLVRAVLAMDVDLLWNGGIGTYVRASGETNADAGDSTNDPVRIPATEVRAKVVGEGGNLGFTQRARIELALRGGRIDTDAIDNSGGVDLSDHEVNLKILLAPLVEAGTLALAQRNRLLERWKPDVVRHVLEHNRRQSLLLSLDQLRSRGRLVEFRDLALELEQDGSLDRALEALPDREALRARRATFPGYTRPELAVIAAYAKLHLQRRLLASSWLEDPVFEQALLAYFPPAVGEKFADAARAHRLRREIIATEVSNQVIDRMGATFAHRMARDTGADAPRAVAAYAVVLGLTDADRLFDALAACAAPVDEVYALCLRWEAAVESAAKLVVGRVKEPGDVAARIAAWKKPVAELADANERPGDEREAEREAEVARLESLGLPAGVARSLAALAGLCAALEVVRLAETEKVDRARAAAAYRATSELLDFPALERWFDGVSAEDRSEKRAAEGLRADVAAARRRLARALLRRREATIERRAAAWVAAHEAELGRLRALVEELKAARSSSIAAMVVVVRDLWRFAGRALGGVSSPTP